MVKQTVDSFLIDWWEKNQAFLPWRTAAPDPYQVWVSEIMAQQTQLQTVIPYFERWLNRFPTVQHLAQASVDEVLKLWEGLGYYSRARNLHQAAQTVVNEWGGEWPHTAGEWQKLKGVGAYTAAAISSICFNEPVAVVDGNVVRVLSRLFDLPDDVTQTPTKKKIAQLAQSLLPAGRPGAFNQALMELGQQICTPRQPACHLCPIATLCQAKQHGTQLERPVKPARQKTPHFEVAAGVIWEKEVGRGRFLIAQRPLEGLLGGLWEFPGGKQEPGETLAETLVREIAEELALTITVPDPRPFVQVAHAYTHFRITLHTFHALWAAGEPQHLGVINHAWVTLAELDNFAFAITDRKIITALKTKEAQSEVD